MSQRISFGLILVGLLMLILGTHRPWQANAAPLPSAGFASGGLITHVQELDGKQLRVVVIDPASRVLGVYDLGRDNGDIKLRSIRNLNADLQMTHFNSEEPSPVDIRKMLEQH